MKLESKSGRASLLNEWTKNIEVMAMTEVEELCKDCVYLANDGNWCAEIEDYTKRPNRVVLSCNKFVRRNEFERVVASGNGG